MPEFEECCVLIPAATLEDFPSDLSDYDARSLLGGWTALWHPHLLAVTEQLPTWMRADAPPDPRTGLLLVIPSPSTDQLPNDFLGRIDSCDDCDWVTGGSRREVVNKIAALNPTSAKPFHDGSFLCDDERTIDVADFYAAGYAYLQIQVMTRRLRYTSNLDQIHLQNRIVDAAKAFLDGNVAETATALHDVFDALAEERDHYFSSSDPHLIDLALSTPSTVNDLLDLVAAYVEPAETNEILATPINILIDQPIAESLMAMPAARIEQLRTLVGSGKIGWAGGGPDPQLCFDTMSLCEAAQCIKTATQACTSAVGTPPKVMARFSGGWPGDMNWTLPGLGYEGVIPIDFAAGTGSGDEAKVLIDCGSGDLEALMAKPIDAADSSAFLTFGSRMGEAIDGGEIATALLAHWPGQGCESYVDLRRAATWSLCLGRFWKLNDYFSLGERPYHHGNIPAVSKSAATVLSDLVERGDSNPISGIAERFRAVVNREQDALIAGLADLIGPERTRDEALTNSEQLAQAIVGPHPKSMTGGTMLINSGSTGSRRTILIDHPIDGDAKHVFALTPTDNQSELTVDIPACGFVALADNSSSAKRSPSLTKRISKRWKRTEKKIAFRERSEGVYQLRNEFMEVVIHPDTGAVSGVYSGQSRGNRFSMKLVCVRGNGVDEIATTNMQCNSIDMYTSTATGTVTVSGHLWDNSRENQLAKFRVCYQLDRGSRVLQVSGTVEPDHPINGDAWQNYFAVRAAVAHESAIFRALVRNKVHRATSRRIVSPLGVMIDEAERQTIVASQGLAFHRRVKDRFLDTLVLVSNQSAYEFRIGYGFDSPVPVAMCKSLIASPTMVPIDTTQQTPAIGWIVHPAPKTVEVSRLRILPSTDGRIVALIRLTQTRSQPCKAVIRFWRDVDRAIQISSGIGANEELDLESLIDSSDDRSMNLDASADRVVMPMAGHEVVDLLVVFRSADSA